MAGEIFDIIGAYGRPESAAAARWGEREYVEGMYWNGGFRSRETNADHGLRANLENVAVLITDLILTAGTIWSRCFKRS